MNTLNTALSKLAPYGPTIMRIIVGGLFLYHGIDKFDTGLSNVEGFFATNGVPAPAITAPFTAIAEIVLGITLIVGLLTRLSALAAAGIMVGAIAFVTEANGILGGIEINLVYIAAFLGVAFVGPGLLSVDEAAKLEDSSNLRAQTSQDLIGHTS